MELHDDSGSEVYSFAPNPIEAYDAYLDELAEQHATVRRNMPTLYEMVSTEDDIPAAKVLLERLTNPNMN
jgi:hypothetical protein